MVWSMENHKLKQKLKVEEETKGRKNKETYRTSNYEH